MNSPLSQKHMSFDAHIEELQLLAEKTPKVTIQEMILLFGSSSHYVLSALLVIPFLQPIPIPGLSSICGAIIALSGLCIARGKKLWLPRWLKKREVQSSHLLRICSVWKRWSKKLHRWIKPRGKFMAKDMLLRRCNGVLLLIAAALLALPLPVPGTNTFPALSIFLITLGTLKEDGALVAAGWICIVLSALYLFYFVVEPLKYILGVI